MQPLDSFIFELIVRGTPEIFTHDENILLRCTLQVNIYPLLVLKHKYYQIRNQPQIFNQ